MAVSGSGGIDQARARLADPARDLARADSRRIILVGARGWIGRTLLSLLREALDPEAFDERVVCFGSTDGIVDLQGYTVPQRALTRISELASTPSMLFHLAFLTKDKVAAMDAEAYERANRDLSRSVHDALGGIGVDRLFVASSGAAAFADDENAAHDLRLYGRLKREDEELFARWAQTAPAVRRAVVGRIYSVSGPWINKPETYALASFILDALSGRPIEVRAPMEVLRSYVAVRELLSLALAASLDDSGEAVLRFGTGGKALELGEVANCVADVLGGQVLRQPIVQERPNRYVGDDIAWQALIGRFGIPHLPLETQIAETAAWLARENDISVPRLLAGETPKC